MNPGTTGPFSSPVGKPHRGPCCCGPTRMPCGCWKTWEWAASNPTCRMCSGPSEAAGQAVVYDDRVFITPDLVEQCLNATPGIKDFFVPLNSFFIGGTAPYIYDDQKGEGGCPPTPEHVARIAQIAQASPMVAGMGRGVKLKDEVKQIEIMAGHCSKPLYFAITHEDSLSLARDVWKDRPNIMIGVLPDATRRWRSMRISRIRTFG